MMVPIFNYNSRAFTILAVCFILAIVYFSEKENGIHADVSNVGRATSGAKYVIEVDPTKSKSDQPWYVRVALAFVGNKISSPPASSPTDVLGGEHDMSKARMGSRVSVVYYRIMPKPDALPQPVELVLGSGTLPKEVENEIIGMSVGQKRVFTMGGEDYVITLVDILRSNVNNPSERH